MSDVAIRVENLGKQYRLGQTERYFRVSELLAGMATAPFRKIGSLRAGLQSAPDDKTGPRVNDTFWAFQDVSFEIRRGDVVGIIGPNGAGKSTLLKVLARITEPTVGRAEIRGRVGSLLEVGTGFHPELTGRENIFLNGAILGMTRSEISQKFDAIVDFAEFEQFLDTPVKRYSSGMYTRLAFAVAAHLEPEILFVDEVLAVGDAAFRRKCVYKMGDLSEEGRTVVFVSHNLAVVRSLCQRGLLMSKGRMQVFDQIDDAVNKYLNCLRPEDPQPSLDLRNSPGRRRGRPVILTGVRLLVDGEPTIHLRIGDSLQVEIDIRSETNLSSHHIWVLLENEVGLRIIEASSKALSYPLFSPNAYAARVRCTFSHLPLVPGSYLVSLFINNDSSPGDAIDRAIGFTIHGTKASRHGYLPSKGKAIVLSESDWVVEPVAKPLEECA